MSIDPTKPVRLVSHVHHGTDFYHPRWYQPGELPEALLIEGVVIQDDAVAAPVTTYKDAPHVQETVVVVEQPVAERVDFQQPQLPIRLQVNTASVDELSKLSGVGAATALKVVTERDKKKFESLQDLSDRVPLPRGKWEDLQSYLLFD